MISYLSQGTRDSPILDREYRIRTHCIAFLGFGPPDEQYATWMNPLNQPTRANPKQGMSWAAPYLAPVEGAECSDGILQLSMLLLERPSTLNPSCLTLVWPAQFHEYDEGSR